MYGPRVEGRPPSCHVWGQTMMGRLPEEFEEVEAGEEVLKIGLSAAEFFQSTVRFTPAYAFGNELRSFKALPPEPLVVSKARSRPHVSCRWR